ncbi:TetR/AcrR family transcriptional regulator [Xanthobacter sp. KR7-65]|uniref:TetR/AcrR family transcriptional regulator n=1 Tax=Xanthobacter sp. KR7-65 TaxID=3156612 RepID=UPI0032B52F08
MKQEGADSIGSGVPTSPAPRRGRARKAAAGGARLGRPPLMDDPRAEILRQAAQLFAQKGYVESSLAQLARAMNYSKGAIYNYFSSKQEIYDAIIIFTLKGLYETAAAAVRDEDPPAERLRHFMVAHARFLADNYDCFVTMLVGFSGMDNSALKADALALRDAHEGLLRRIIADGVADGSFRDAGAAMTGRAVLSLLSWMVRWFRPDGSKTAEQVAEEYHDLLVRGLMA